MVAVKYIIPFAIREHKIICMSHLKKKFSEYVCTIKPFFGALNRPKLILAFHSDGGLVLKSSALRGAVPQN